MPPAIRYPAGPVTPHGAHAILRDRVPMVTLTSPDETIVFHLMGGLAIPDRQAPERVEITGLKGLMAPWQAIEQKGATEDGTTFIDALGDPIDVEMDVVCHGRNPAYARKVNDHLTASLSSKKTSRLAWFTHQLGYWWADVRWGAAPATGDYPVAKRQEKALKLRAHHGFWQSYPNVDEFRPTIFDGDDDFEDDDPDGLSASWTVAYTGAGSGNVFVDDGEVKSTLNNKTAIARNDDYTSPNDNQIVQIRIGRKPLWYFHPDAHVDIWFRMKSTGTPGQDGIRLRIKRHKLIVSSFNSGVETVLRERILIIPLLTFEKLTVIVGKPAGLLPADPRWYTLLRGGAPVMSFKEQGATSQLGATFRKTGFGVGTTSSGLPPGIMSFEVGGNSVITQSGFLRRINAGDQDMWDRYTCFGPFQKIKIWNGPNAGPDEYVEFGPLLENQVAQIRTDPRKYGVKDLTSVGSTPTEQAAHKDALQDFLSFITFNNVTHILDVFQSIFGLLGGGSAPVPPQGNLYSLLKGRFSKPIPPKPAGLPAQEYFVKVEMVGGTADSRVIASGTPLRRYPV